MQRSWIVQFRIGTQQRKQKIGDVAKLNPDQARKRATEILAKVTLGQDPVAEKRAAQAGMTFGAAVDAYLKLKATKLRPSSLRVATLYLTNPRYFPFAKKPLDRITLSDVSARLDTITTDISPDTASQCRAHISALFTWAMTRGHAISNPSPIRKTRRATGRANAGWTMTK